MLTLDSLYEQGDAPVPGLTHRYPDKALFLALDTCPVYCRFCTRSYAVGIDTDSVEKVSLKVDTERWANAFKYMRERPELEDVVVSGGDAYRLKPKQLLEIGHALLDIPHIRRFRFATKGLAVVPMRIKPGDPWTEAVTEVVERGRKLGKEVVLHTHFNHAAEATGFSQDAAQLLHERGIYVRNQSVLQRGVNDTAASQILLARRLSYRNVHPYYVYVTTSSKASRTCAPRWRPPSASRSACAAPRRASTPRPSSSTPSAAAASATPTASSPTTRRPASRSSARPR
jgi:lysine 2,3-aminomutase